MKVEEIKIGDLIEYEHNSRVHSEDQISNIAASIKEFGFCNPVLIGSDGVLIAGHGRLSAARLLGFDSVPVIRLKHLTRDQQRALVIADNRIAEGASWNEELLKSELAALSSADFDLSVMGFNDAELRDFLNAIEDEASESLPSNINEAPETTASPVVAKGDIWILGKHRVRCGDSCDSAGVSELCSHELVDMVWTDPPYNVAYESAAGSIANDDMSADEFRRFLLSAFTSMALNLKEGGSCYVAHADTEGLAFRSAFEAAGFKLSGCLVWVKPALVLGRSDYQWRHEPILYGWKTGAAHSWFGGRKQTTVHEVDDSPLRFMPDGSVQLDVGDQTVVVTGSDLQVASLDGSVIRAAKPSRNDVHPTMKPVEIMARHIRNSTAPGEVVLDIFGGSGSTLIACEVTGRVARLSELEPKFCDVIVRRWQDLTGGEARLADTGESFSEVEERRRDMPE